MKQFGWLAGACALALTLAGCDLMYTTPLPPPGTAAAAPTDTAVPPTPSFPPEVIQSATALAMGVSATATPTALGKGLETAGPVETATPLFIDEGPTQDPNLPAGCQAVHIVAAGEWLELIARTYDVTSGDIALANGLTNPEALAVGQVLCIPAPGAVFAPPGPTLAPTFTPPPGDGLAVLSFAASPNPVERGGVLRLTWTVRSAASVRVWRLVFDSKLGRWFRPEAPAYTGTGNADLTWPVPLDERQGMRFELEAVDANGQTISVESEVGLACYPPFYVSAPSHSACLSVPRTMPAEFQQFEHGAIIWLSDTGEVYVLPLRTDTYHPWSLQLPTGEGVTPGTPPQGLFAPGARFAEVWAARATTDPDDPTTFADVLGWATSPPQPYPLTIQPMLDARYPMFDAVFLSWPDGRVAQLFTGGGLPRLGLAGPAWAFLNL